MENNMIEIMGCSKEQAVQKIQQAEREVGFKADWSTFKRTDSGTFTILELKSVFETEE